MNQTDAALNKSEISQFSLTEQKQPLGRYDDSGQNQRRQRLEIRGYNNNELLNYEKINECRQDSSRSDDHHSNHKQDNLVGEGQPKSAFLLQHMQGPSLTPKSKAGMQQFQGPPSSRYQATVTREPKTAASEKKSFDKLTDFYRDNRRRPE